MMAETPWGLRPWMVVVIVGRELLVTALRSFIEDRGSDFSAKMSGKLKMVLQCVAAGVCLFYLSYGSRPRDQLVLVAAGGVGLVGVGLDRVFRRGLHPCRGAVAAGVRNRESGEPRVESSCEGNPPNTSDSRLSTLHSRLMHLLAEQLPWDPIVPVAMVAVTACAAVWVWWRRGGGRGGLSYYQPRRPVPWKPIDLAVVVLFYLVLHRE